MKKTTTTFFILFEALGLFYSPRVFASSDVNPAAQCAVKLERRLIRSDRFWVFFEKQNLITDDELKKPRSKRRIQNLLLPTRSNPNAVFNIIEEIIQSACNEIKPGEFKYPPRSLDTILLETWNEWHADQKPNSVFHLIRMITNQFDEASNEKILNLFVVSIQNYLSSHLEGLKVDTKAKLWAGEVIKKRYQHVKHMRYRSEEMATITTSNLTLLLDISFSEQSLLFKVFHDLIHLSVYNEALYHKPLQDITADEWIHLAIKDEFRAYYLTKLFESAWYEAYPQMNLELKLGTLTEEFQVFEMTIPTQIKLIDESIAHFLNTLSLAEEKQKQEILAGFFSKEELASVLYK